MQRLQFLWFPSSCPHSECSAPTEGRKGAKSNRSESLGPICPLEALPFGPPSSPVSIVRAQDMLLGVRCMCVCLSLPHVLPYLPLLGPWYLHGQKMDLCFCVGKPMGCCLPIQPFLSPILCPCLPQEPCEARGGRGRGARPGRRDRESRNAQWGSRPRTTSSGRQGFSAQAEAWPGPVAGWAHDCRASWGGPRLLPPPLR